MRHLGMKDWLAAVVVVWLVALVVVMASCATPPPSPQPPPGPPEQATCMMACYHLEQLGCQNGGACYEVCRRINNPDLNACLYAAPSCAVADDCDI